MTLHKINHINPTGNLPKKITMADGSYVASDYMPDGTLRNRVFATRTIQTVVRVTADGDTIRTSRPITQSAWHRYFGQFESTPGGWLYHTPACPPGPTPPPTPSTSSTPTATHFI